MSAPWPCRHGDAAGTGRSAWVGPARGVPGPRWAFPKGLRHWCGPVVGAGGRIALAIDVSLLVFGPDLRDPRIVSHSGIIRSLAATEDGGFLVAGVTGVARVNPDLTARGLPLLSGWMPAEGMVEVPGGDLWAWRDSNYVRAGPDGLVRHEGDVAPGTGWSGPHIHALAVDGSRAHAACWTAVSGGRGTHASAVFAASPDGLPLFRKERAQDSLPTEEGVEVRLMALPDGVVMAARGAVLWDWDGRERWREQREDVTRIVSPSPGSLVYVRDGVHLLRVRPPSGFEQLHEAPRGEGIVDVVADGQEHLYLAEPHAVIALDERGKVRFRAPVAGVRTLCVGAGFLVGVQHPLSLVRID